MTLTHSSHSLLRLLCVACVCLIAAPLFGCGGKKEEAAAPGYYDGPLQKKAPTAPAGGATAPDAPPTRGKMSTD